MRVFEWPAIWTILLDFIAWFVIHMVTASVTLHLPDHCFEQDRFLYRCRSWERSGTIWQTLFQVRKWKERLPDGSAILKKGFAKKHLKARDSAYLAAFVRESRRAEFTHWIAMPFALLFFLWNPPAVGWGMILYAIAANAPCVIAQRYNRPRFQRILNQQG